MYRHVDSAKLTETTAQLAARISERFPGSGLSRVASELLTVVRETDGHCRWIAQPLWWLRALVGGLIALLVASLAATFLRLDLTASAVNWSELVQGIEAGLNDLVMVGIAIYFLVGIETRIKRARSLRGLHQLRAIAHVVDMHQLAKNPEAILGAVRSGAAGDGRRLSPLDLVRYLDFCSEMLALVSKSAALYGQYLNDAVILQAVTELESLTTNLSHKIWQKINIFELYRSRADTEPASPVPAVTSAAAPLAAILD